MRFARLRNRSLPSHALYRTLNLVGTEAGPAARPIQPPCDETRLGRYQLALSALFGQGRPAAAHQRVVTLNRYAIRPMPVIPLTTEGKEEIV